MHAFTLTGLPMKTYSKRIAFIISSQHLIAHGGIGQFAKGFLEMSSDLNWIVDLILDGAPNKTPFVDALSGMAGRVVSPSAPLSNARHTKTYAFSESYNMERAINFRESMMEAFQYNIYDMVIVNTPEAIIPLFSFGIDPFVPIVFYTHNENIVFQDNTFKGVFNQNFDEFFLNIIRSTKIYIGTQSHRNMLELMSYGYGNAVELPMPLPERGLREKYEGEKEGVLFIGRWEDRKNYKDYLAVLKETGLPAKVMTNAKGAAKFEAALKDIGVKYEIAAGITGQEKCDFIRSSKVAFMPSKSESYCFAFFEAHGHVPTVVLEEYDWYKNFDETKFVVSNKKKAASDIKRLYEEGFDVDLEYIKSIDDAVKGHWLELFHNFIPHQSSSNASKISQKDNLFYHNHIKDLKRFASIEDVISVLSNRQKFEVCYTNEGTWLSSTGLSVVEENNDNTLIGMFG